MDLKKRLASLDRLTSRPSQAPLPGQPVAARAESIFAELLDLGLCPLTDDPRPGLDQVMVLDHADQVPCPADPLPSLKGFFVRGGQEAASFRQVLFLDTETTGLMGGTGTLAFLVGVSWWEAEDRLRTRQYFLSGPGAEPGLLSALHDLAAGFRVVATYNGAAFDLPLLRTRALLNRMVAPWDEVASWDLLVPCRRLWGRALPDCRQQTLEREVCGLRRGAEDLPGHLIPQTWFHFLQGGGTGDLQRVLYHNRRDMVGLAHIFGHLVRHAEDLEKGPSQSPAGPTGPGGPWHRAWRLGCLAECRNQPELMSAWHRESLQLARRAGPEPFAEERFVADILRVVKRRADWPEVENIIARALESGQNGPWLHREAAILFEHRLVCLDRALHHARHCRDGHRIRRLEGKLAKAGAPPEGN